MMVWVKEKQSWWRESGRNRYRVDQGETELALVREPSQYPTRKVDEAFAKSINVLHEH